MKLAGKTALVTGASSGIGLATARALAREGADVALNFLGDPAQPQALARELEGGVGRVLLLPGDVSDQPAVEAMIARVAAELGRLDILVTSAVYSDRELFHAARMEGFRRTIEVTMWGAFYCLRAAANQMIRQNQGGSVVLVSSGQANIAIAGSMAYNMAKAAVDQMGRTAALELARYRIRVNIIHPGWTDTPGERKFFTEDALQRGGSTLPAGRLARPEEIARGIVFLADPASEYITGTTLSIDGGARLPWWAKREKGEF